jgi:hypothetical protein
MSEEKKAGCGSCLSSLGSLVVVVVLGFMFTSNGGLSVRLGNITFAFGKPTFDGKPMGTLMEAETVEANKKVAEVVVKAFHEQIAQGKCDEIYNQSSSALKNSQKREEFSVFCDQWKQVGGVQSAEIIDWWGKPTENQERKILMRYQTMTQKFLMIETFVWLINKENKAELITYQYQPIGVTRAKQPSPSPISGEGESKR